MHCDVASRGDLALLRDVALPGDIALPSELSRSPDAIADLFARRDAALSSIFPDASLLMSDASEFRQDAITRQWVVCAPARSDRPKQFEEDADPVLETDGPVNGCPFCPGHEHMLPEVLFEASPDGSETNGSARSWHTRSVPNKYPALTQDGTASQSSCSMYECHGGYGRQEVIIATPRHHESLSRMPTSHLETVVQTYLHRYHALRQAGDGLIPFIFHNYGADAGASLPHPHSQIIAPSIEPPDVVLEEERARQRYGETGQCPYCEMLDKERTAEARMVAENDAFAAFVPYAARAPYEMWILPTEHEPEFGRLGGQASALADVLHQTLRALRLALGDPDYNFYVRTALAYESTAPHLHWSLRIRPRISIDAGFEIGTGMKINPSLPERDADVLREAIASFAG
jgi:UDPglucose--hexose-1-phosphate uridylyltransferase